MGLELMDVPMEHPPFPPIDASISVTHYPVKIRGNLKLLRLHDDVSGLCEQSIQFHG
jgi:hypothetical protein